MRRLYPFLSLIRCSDYSQSERSMQAQIRSLSSFGVVIIVNRNGLRTAFIR